MKYFVSILYCLIFIIFYTFLHLINDFICNKFGMLFSLFLNLIITSIILIYFINKHNLRIKRFKNVNLIIIFLLIQYLYDILFFVFTDKKFNFLSPFLQLKYLSTIILFPIIEELFFRFYLWKILPLKHNENLKIIFISLMFSCMHFNNLYSMSSAFLFSILATKLFSLNKNLTDCILFHISYNLLYFLFLDKTI